MQDALKTLLPLARKMAVPPGALVALPTVIEVFAQKADMTEEAIVAECHANPDLLAYAEQMCIKAWRAL